MKKEDIVLLDGAVGTSLWEKTENKVAVWRYNIENPEIVLQLAREYVDAGAQIVLANTFGANRIAVKTSGYSVQEVVSKGVRLAKQAVDGRAKVALSAGPLPLLLEPYGDMTEDECYEAFDEQISAGVAEGPDIIMLQTFMDIEMMKIAVKAASKHNLPIFCMMTFTEVGKTMMGNSVEDCVEELKDLPVTAIGINCSLGPEKAVPVVKQFRQYTDLPLIFKPNAGMPIQGSAAGATEYDIDAFVEGCMPALDCDVKYIGGCCGSNPAYIRALKKRIWG